MSISWMLMPLPNSLLPLPNSLLPLPNRPRQGLPCIRPCLEISFQISFCKIFFFEFSNHKYGDLGLKKFSLSTILDLAIQTGCITWKKLFIEIFQKKFFFKLFNNFFWTNLLKKAFEKITLKKNFRQFSQLKFLVQKMWTLKIFTAPDHLTYKSLNFFKEIFLK